MPVLSGIDLDQTLGALFIGHFVASSLYGLSTLQTYTYYGRSSNDSPSLKWLVAVLWVLDSLQMILISHTFYTYAVTHFGDLEALGKVTWSIVTQIIVTCMSDAIVRGIFCYRIWILTATECFSLQTVDTIIRTLIMYSINTAALTAVGTLLCLITFAVSPKTFIFIAFYFVLAKLLLNSLLAGLNTRRALRDQIRLLGGSSSADCGQLSSYASMGGNRFIDPNQIAEFPIPPRNVYPAHNHKGLTVAV
ncbi:hypothetical protein C8Q80DRAFT_1271589 [Daedaleopsis nitida]|nr:hypothetical protein C8Q80DRAFT_1271589 [Daedaleopsis nitida]